MTITSWRAEWNAIAARIEGLVRTGEFFYRSIQTPGKDPHGAVTRILLPQSDQCYQVMAEYIERYANVLPAQAADCLKRFLEEFGDIFKAEPKGVQLGRRILKTQLRVMALIALRSEFEYCVAGIQDQIRATSERAFLHLQRCIVADGRYREQWQAAFDKGETCCEKLGGVHLLWHGIWAFKVGAKGGRTDLVMGNQIDNPSEVERTALGMVLTEWKRAADEREVEVKYRQGKEQVAQYSEGVLGGVELADTRYVVVVTEHMASGNDEVDENGITYKFVNIAVDPEAPSQAARRA